MVHLNLKVMNNIPLLTASSDRNVRIKLFCDYIDIPYFIAIIREAAEYEFKYDWTWLN